jgi:hypothetical protein
MKRSRFIVLEPVFLLLRFTFLSVVALFRLRDLPLPRNLSIIFCVEAVTCLEIMSVVCSGGFAAICLMILVSVRNASRPKALMASLPTDLAPLQRVLNNPAKMLPNPCPLYIIWSCVNSPYILTPMSCLALVILN